MERQWWGDFTQGRAPPTKANSRADMSWHWADWCTTLSLWTIIISIAYYLSSSWLIPISRGWRHTGTHNWAAWQWNTLIFTLISPMSDHQSYSQWRSSSESLLKIMLSQLIQYRLRFFLFYKKVFLKGADALEAKIKQWINENNMGWTVHITDCKFFCQRPVGTHHIDTILQLA